MDVTTVLADTRDAMQTIWDGAKSDDGAARALTDIERTEFDALGVKADGLVESVKAYNAGVKQSADDEAKLKSLSILPTIDKREPLSTVAPTQEAVDAAGKAAEVSTGKSLGQLFTGTKSYKSALERDASSINVEVAKSLEMVAGPGLKTLLTTPTPGTSVEVSGYAMQPHALLSAVTVGRTGKDSLVRHVATRSTENAAVAAEGAAYGEDALTFVSVTLTPDRVGAFLPVTEQTLSDFEGMETLINDELVDDTLNAVEAKIAAVLAAATGVQAQAFATSMLISIRQGITLAENYAEPTGVLIGTADAQTLDLLTSTGDFGPQPFGAQPTHVWGLPMIRTNKLPSGFAYVGRIKTLQWLERQPMTVQVGTTGTQFVEDELTIKASTRGVTHVAKPISWVKVDTVA